MRAVPVEDPEELAEEQRREPDGPDEDEPDEDEPDDDEPDEPTAARRLTTADESREEAVAAATSAVQRGELVVLPTDTVYGIGADAFDAEAVQSLLDAK